MSHNAYDHNCHGVALDTFMADPGRLRWREVAGVWPDDYQKPPMDVVRLDPAWDFPTGGCVDETAPRRPRPEARSWLMKQENNLHCRHAPYAAAPFLRYQVGVFCMPPAGTAAGARFYLLGFGETPEAADAMALQSLRAIADHGKRPAFANQ